MRGILPTSLTSAEIEQIDADLLRRAQFSATVEDIRHLDLLSRTYREVLAGKLDVATGRLRLKQFLAATGYQAPEGKEGTLQDLSSTKRIDLQIDTNVEMMRGLGSHIQGQDEAILDMWPAQELIRVTNFDAVARGTARDWNDIWLKAGGPKTDAWPRMIALKDHPIWVNISRFKNPWPPFDYRSGMGLEDLTRREAMALRLIDLKRRVEPDREAVREIAGGAQATLAIADPRLKAALEATGVGRFDPDGVYRITDEFAGGGDAPFANTRSYRRDSLGQFAKDGGPLNEEKNIARGNAAVERALRSQADVPNAMHVAGLGRVDFLWGRPGHTAPDAGGRTHTDGYGISHIVAKHGEDAARAVPVVLARGKIGRHPKDDAKREVRHKNYFMVVRRQSDTGAYVITNFDEVNGP